MAKKSITTSNTNSTILTTSNTNISSSSSGTLWTTTTDTSTYYNPNIGNQFVYQSTPPTPFHINFSWDGKIVDVTLKDGNDVFKLANAFMKWLDANEIEYSVKTKGKKRKK